MSLSKNALITALEDAYIDRSSPDDIMVATKEANDYIDNLTNFELSVLLEEFKNGEIEIEYTGEHFFILEIEDCSNDFDDLEADSYQDDFYSY